MPLTLARFSQLQPGLVVSPALFTDFALAAETWRIARTIGLTGLNAAALEQAEAAWIVYRDRLVAASTARQEIGDITLENRGTVKTPAARAEALEDESNRWLAIAESYLKGATTPPQLPYVFPGVAR